MNTKTLPTIGFIGTGIMGKSMALHIIKAGYPLHVFNRSKEKTASLIEQGAIWHHSPKELATHADIIITIIGYPKDVEEVYLGVDGILAGAKAGSIAIDMTTSSPSSAARIAKDALSKKIAVLDAPVSGGDIGARDARLRLWWAAMQMHLNRSSLFWNVWAITLLFLAQQAPGSMPNFVIKL